MIVKRVQKSGKANFFYLPQKWITDFGIKAGDYVNIKDSPFGELIVSPVNTKRVTENIELNVNDCDLTFLKRLVFRCFISGFDSFAISIKKTFNRNELLASKKNIDLLISGMEITDISSNHLKLNFSAETPAVMPLFKSFLNNAENFVSAVRYNDTELSKHYKIEFERGFFLVLRSVNKSLRSISSDISKSDAVTIMELVNNISNSIIEQEIKAKLVNDYELIIETIRLLKSDFDKLSLDTVQKLALILDKFKSSTVKFFFKHINRLLISYYLNKIVINH